MSGGVGCHRSARLSGLARGAYAFVPGETRRLWSSMTRSPSSFLKAALCGLGRMLSTVSEGLQSRTPIGATTMGRLMRMGCAIMASILMPFCV